MRQTSTTPSPPNPPRPFLLRPAGLPGSARANVFILTIGIGVGFFLAIEPTQPWLLVLVASLTALGMSTILQLEAAAAGEAATDAAAPTDASNTIFSLVIPVLWVFGTGLLAEYVAGGYWSLAAAGAITIGFGAIVYAETTSLRPTAQGYQGARFLLNVAAYVIAFALFAAPYAIDLGNLPAALFVGIAAALMATELMREAPASSLQVLLLASGAGLLLGEARAAFYFLPLDKFLAATLLLLMFYIVTGVLQSQLLSRPTASAALEYAVVATTGLLLIVAAQALI